MGEMVNFDSGDQRFEGYLAKARSGGGPGVLVIQEWWGLVGHIKDVTDRFAAEGFTALAPDLYHGKQTTEPDEAGSLMMALNIGEAAQVLSRAADWLSRHEAVAGEKVGVVGFCMGGQLSLYTACISDKIGACVDYYGIHPNVKPDLDRLRAPLLGFFADNDPYATPEAVANLKEELTKRGKRHDFITYPGRDHAFFNDDRPEVYDAEAALDTWRRMTAFLREHLHA
jgi:carboxymethylenebutenolidase